MYKYEGLGSIYWHMVSKLLLAVQEMLLEEHAPAGEDEATLERLGDAYYRVRAGLSSDKTPQQYGAFPMDPYSHSPGHMGAQQPGMTGQVKEEVLTRWGELGLRVEAGALKFDPALLRRREFLDVERPWTFVDATGSFANDHASCTLAGLHVLPGTHRVPVGRGRSRSHRHLRRWHNLARRRPCTRERNQRSGL